MRDHHRILVHNILAIFASTTVSRAIKLLLIITATRVFGAEDYGRFAYVMVSASLAVIFIDLGVSRFIVQQLARDQQESSIYLGHSLMINICTGSILVCCLYSYFAMFDARSDMKYIALVLGLSVLGECLTASYQIIFRSQQKLVRQAWVIAFTNIITFCAGFLVLFLYPNLLLFSFSVLLASLARLAVSRYLVTTFFHLQPVFRPSKQIFFYLLKGGIPFLLTSTFVYIYYQVDTLFLEHFWNSAVVGYYNAAYQLVAIPLSISSIITTALFPAVSKLFKENQEQMRETITKTFSIAMVLSLPVSITVAALSERITTIAYGAEFTPSSTALRILILGVAVIFPSTVLGTSLRGIGLQVRLMWITGFGALLNIILNYLFIPRYGMTGAAWTTLSTEIWVITAYFLLMVKQYGNFLFNKNSVLIIAVNVPLIVFFYMSRNSSIWITIPIAVVYYLIIIEITGLLPLKDLKKLKNQKI